MTTLVDSILLSQGTTLKRFSDDLNFDKLGSVSQWTDIVSSIYKALPIPELFSPLEIRVYDLNCKILLEENQKGIPNVRNETGNLAYQPVSFFYDGINNRISIGVFSDNGNFTDKSKRDAFIAFSRNFGYHYANLCGITRNFILVEDIETRFSKIAKIQSRYPVEVGTSSTRTLADEERRRKKVLVAFAEVFSAFFGIDFKPPSKEASYSVRGTFSDNSLFWKEDSPSLFITLLCYYNIYKAALSSSRQGVSLGQYLLLSEKNENWVTGKDSLGYSFFFYYLDDKIISAIGVLFPGDIKKVILEGNNVSKIEKPYLTDRQYWEYQIAEENKPSLLTQEILQETSGEEIVLTQTFEVEENLNIGVSFKRFSYNEDFNVLGTRDEWSNIITGSVSVLPYYTGLYNTLKLHIYHMNTPVLKIQNEQGQTNLRDHSLESGFQAASGLYWSTDNRLEIGVYPDPWDPQNNSIPPIVETDKIRAFKVFSHEFGHHYENMCLGPTVPANLKTFIKDKIIALFNNDPRPGVNNNFAENFAELIRAFFGYNENFTDITQTKATRGTFSTQPPIKYWRPDNKHLYCFLKFLYRFVQETKSYNNTQIADLSNPTTGLIIRDDDLYWASPDNKVSQIYLFGTDIAVKKWSTGTTPPEPGTPEAGTNAKRINDPIPALYAFDFSTVTPPAPEPDPENPPPSPEPLPEVTPAPDPAEGTTPLPFEEEGIGVVNPDSPNPPPPSPPIITFPEIKDVVRNVYS